MTIDEAKRIDLTEFIKRLGHSEVERKGHPYEAWFLSPLRRESNPSFKVDRRTQRWHDFGGTSERGGDIVDFVRSYRTGVDGSKLGTGQALKEIASLLEGSGLVPADRRVSTDTIAIEPKKKTPLRILYVGEVESPALKEYLSSRGIEPDGAMPYVRQLHYENTVNGGRYFGLAWRNLRGGWELRNPYAKVSIGPKDASSFVIPNGKQPGTAVFEGMTDFLTYKQLAGDRARQAAIVMNSASMLDRTITYANRRSGEGPIDLWLQNDRQGLQVTEAFREAIPSATVKNGSYSQYADLNDYLTGRKHGVEATSEARATLGALDRGSKIGVGANESGSDPRGPRLRA